MLETEEQKKARETLVAEYGLEIFTVAVQLSGLKNALAGTLQEDTLDGRRIAVVMANRHLTNLLLLLMPPTKGLHVVECCRRVDAFIDIWAADDMER